MKEWAPRLALRNNSEMALIVGFGFLKNWKTNFWLRIKQKGEMKHWRKFDFRLSLLSQDDLFSILIKLKLRQINLY